MSTLENNIWKELTQDFNSDLHNVLLQQHHAAQFIALVGRHMLPQQADDSNTNMQCMAGREIPLSGLNKEQIFEQLKKSLAELDLVSDFHLSKQKKDIGNSGSTWKALQAISSPAALMLQHFPAGQSG